ncbi:hypothetical protein O0I10_011342 [Lichtheimia ornata]|uniref:F-box domain-containing protein n=1 Tax=Lichtheimia ornata TaxID=688661 RepID=A0AAD7UUT7_9FUNG|nr:uncharacterized protein O0I10_011342 [Lichtheimia ornata]KAJ8653042.1 hypothetical protein O0I10_011342 [Lichtheimia ornata]
MTVVASKALSHVRDSFSTSLQRSQPVTNDIPMQQQQQGQHREQHLPTLTAQEKETNMIMLESKQADGYLLAGQFNEGQRRYSKGQTIHADSLPKVPLRNPHCWELRRSLKKLNMRRGAFIYLFPYHVSCIIFDHLSHYELTTCLDVCELWSHFILQWPGFWDTHRHKHVFIDRTVASSFLDDKNDHFRIPSYVDNRILGPMLKFVVATSSWRYKHLEFEHMSLKKEHIDLVLEAVQSPNSIGGVLN